MHSDFELGTRKFKLSKINAIKQFHILRRCAPIMAEILPAMKQAGKYTTEEKLKALPDAEKWEMVSGIAGPALGGLSKLKDEDAELVLYGLLESVEVQHAGAWSKVCSGGILMMQDMELPVLMNLAGRAFVYNLSGFFSALPQK